ncbi:hypothetical protein JGUZn3_05700 [Entomobacter blattae]|uniref:F5/8 type C domain-containing protein n=2 Tax=Entomobacter blattae TaxID=2762277 RepID=A0A7H1NPV5_9PROT|nr:hypothetical protein JGUZn3_05700 [Entomobacter blattae]
MKYAVFFKVHMWNETIEKVYNKLITCVKTGDVFILHNNTDSSIEDKYGNLVTINMQEALDVGLNISGGFWHNGDYPSILSFLKMPHYDYYVHLEYDVFVNNNIDDIITIMENENIDVIGAEDKNPVHIKDWVHTSFCIPYYAVDEIRRGLYCIVFLSKRAVVSLLARRLRQSAMQKEYNLQTWPFSEAVIATEVFHSNLKARDLKYFCDNLDYYDWKDVSLVDFAEEKSLGKKTFFHPVADLKKFIHLNFQTSRKIDNILLEKIIHAKNTKLFCLSYHLPENNEDNKKQILESYKQVMGNKDLEYIFDNIISVGCVATQSSISRYSASDNEADRVLNILPRYGYSIHTEKQENPWWMVDLGEEKDIKNIYFFDRPDFGGERTQNLRISVANNPEEFHPIFQKNNTDLIWNYKIEVSGKYRFVKIHLEGEGLLNFDTCVITGP